MKKEGAMEFYIFCLNFGNMYYQKSCSNIQNRWYRIKLLKEMIRYIRINRENRVYVYKVEKKNKMN